MELDGKKIALFVADQFDAVIIPGGWAPDKLRRCQHTLDFVKDLHNDGRIVASICHGGWVLASADIVSGKTLTSTPAIKDDLVHAGAKWVDQEIVIDNGLITSRNPDDLPAFCSSIIDELAN